MSQVPNLACPSGISSDCHYPTKNLKVHNKNLRDKVPSGIWPGDSRIEVTKVLGQHSAKRRSNYFNRRPSLFSLRMLIMHHLRSTCLTGSLITRTRVIHSLPKFFVTGSGNHVRIPVLNRLCSMAHKYFAITKMVFTLPVHTDANCW